MYLDIVTLDLSLRRESTAPLISALRFKAAAAFLSAEGQQLLATVRRAGIPGPRVNVLVWYILVPYKAPVSLLWGLCMYDIGTWKLWGGDGLSSSRV